jgi:hypothetical protein
VERLKAVAADVLVDMQFAWRSVWLLVVCGMHQEGVTGSMLLLVCLVPLA